MHIQRMYRNSFNQSPPRGRRRLSVGNQDLSYSWRKYPRSRRFTFSRERGLVFSVSGPNPGSAIFDLGPQNSRGFRALKVWLALQEVGRAGYVQTIGTDIALARELFEQVRCWSELQALTQSPSITTFRFVPPDLSHGGDDEESYLNWLNSELLTRLQNSGEAYLSNAIMHEKFALRACIVNFRTSAADIEALSSSREILRPSIENIPRHRSDGG